MKKLIPIVTFLLLVGCSINPGKNSEPVEVAGSITRAGKPTGNLTLHFQPTGNGVQTDVQVKAGVYKGQITPGKYTYFLSSSNPAAMNAIPEKYRQGSMDRQVTISSAQTLDVDLDK